jgi:hypothetical protein
VTPEEQDEHDTQIEAMIERALEAGWLTTMQVHGPPEHSLSRYCDPFLDVVTLPLFGHSIATRIEGFPCPGRWRTVGVKVWEHRAPLFITLQWLLTDPADDAALANWEQQHQRQHHTGTLR